MIRRAFTAVLVVASAAALLAGIAAAGPPMVLLNPLDSSNAKCRTRVVCNDHALWVELQCKPDPGEPVRFNSLGRWARPRCALFWGYDPAVHVHDTRCYGFIVSAPFAFAIAVVLGLYPGAVVARGIAARWRHRRRRGRGLCVRCGYDLTGNISGVCPECGTTIPSPAVQADRVDAS